MLSRGSFFMDKGDLNKKENLWHSQNFLHDSQFVASLVGMSSITSEDTVIEIGPGKGIITEQLVQLAGKVIGVEYAHDLALQLKEKFSNTSKVDIVGADFLKWSLPNYRYKIFSNIPFEYTTRIVEKILESSKAPDEAYLIMQDLAAKRFMGKPFDKDSQISILLQPFYSMSILCDIDKRQYRPVPSVDTVLAKFEKREKPLIELKNMQEYRDFVVYGYNQWKPTVSDAFKDVFSYKQMKVISRNINIQGSKPLDLEVNDWVSLFKTYQKYVPDQKKSQVKGSEKRLKNKQKGMEKEYRTRR
jgi:23S rRNA (adenine-N6)-dimethyltransferase